MARRKLEDSEKKPSIALTLDKELDSLLEQYLDENGITRSKYIESLVRADMEERGCVLKKEFEK